MALMKLCRCGRTMDASLKRCTECEKTKSDRHKYYDMYQRDKKAAAFYKSKEWQKVRELVLSRDLGLCVRCLANHVEPVVFADMVDHIIPLKIDWHLRLESNNLQSLCNRCHRIKTLEDKKKYGEMLR